MTSERPRAVRHELRLVDEHRILVSYCMASGVDNETALDRVLSQGTHCYNGYGTL